MRIGLTLRRVRAVFGPLVIWLGAIVACIFLYRDAGPSAPLLGFAERIDVGVTSVETGRVDQLFVERGDRVEAGQTVALLDPTDLDHQIRIIEAERRQVTASLDQARAEARKLAVAELFERDRWRETTDRWRETTDRELSAATATLTTRRAELRAARRELATLKKLATAEMLERTALTDLQIRVSTLHRAVTEAKNQVTLLQQHAGDGANNALAGSGATPAPDADPVEVATAPFREQLGVLDKRVLALEARRDRLLLRAPSAGQVAAIHVHAGEVATPNASILDITRGNVGRVVACLTEDRADTVALGSPVTIRLRHDLSAPVLTGKTVTLSAITELPVRCRRQPRIPMWGREAVIELDEPTQLLSGQAYEIRVALAEDA